jgi:hypothetical protein
LVGCQWLRRGEPAAATTRIEGISAVRYDGLDLVVEKAPAGVGADWTLIGPDGPGEAAVLRTGKEFALTDGRTFVTIYRVMLLSEDRIVLRRTQRVPLPDGSGSRESSEVVSLVPYEE